MTAKFQPVRGAKWFRDIANDSSRQFGIEIHHHLPQKDVSFDFLSYDKIVSHPQELHLMRSLSDFYGEIPTTRTYPDTYAATIENGTIIGNSGMVVTPDGYIIAETASLTGYKDRRCLCMHDLKNRAADLEFAGHVSGNVLSLANPNGGYSHHLMESFFPIVWLVGLPFNFIHTATGINRELIKECLGALEIPTACVVSTKSTQYCTADQVTFFAPNSFLLLRSETVELIEKMLVAPRRTKKAATKKLYLETGIKAPGAKQRVPKNEYELREYLIINDYECIDPATLNIVEKIDLFSQAKETIVLGGSGAANPLYFAPNKAKIGMLVDKTNLVKTFITPYGNIPVSGYSDIPILPVYSEFCHNNGKLMSLWGVTLKTSAQRYPNLQRLSYSINPSPHPTIDMKRFKEWFEIFSEDK